MMSKITLILFEFILIAFIVQSNNANVTQTCETVASVEERFNFQLQTYVKVYNLKIEDLEKQISGNLMNVKTWNFCSFKAYQFEKLINKLHSDLNSRNN